MKKTFILIVSMMFLLGFTVSAFALHAEVPAEVSPAIAMGKTQITLGGSIRIRGEFKNNTGDALDDENSSAATNDDHAAAYDQRLRLKMDARVSDTVRGFVELETANNAAQPAIGGSTAWGMNDGGRGIYQQGNQKQSDLQVLQAWIHWYAMDNVSLKIGHMPITLGNHLFYQHNEFGDDAILLTVDPMENTHVTLFTLKLDDLTPTNGDSDAYGVIVSHGADMFNASADITYLEDGDGDLDGAGTGIAALGKSIELWNIGVRGDVSPMENLTVRADVEFQFGDIDTETGAAGLCSTTAAKDCEFGGYAFLIGADFKINDITLTGEYAMGSGDDDASDNDADLFITSLSSTQRYTYVYDYRSATSAGFTNAGVANTSYIKGAVSGKVSPELSAKAAVYYLKATEDVNMQSILGGTTAGSTDDDLGWEIDGKVSYQLATNLEYWVEGRCTLYRRRI